MHPIVSAAAEGELPAWAEASESRRAHMRRVADVMERWASVWGLPDEEITRWRATAMLHDALRDAEFDALRPIVDPVLRDRPGKMLHGPATATRLRDEGVEDHALVLAVAWHTLGHPGFDRLGRALYLADYLEPGREYESDAMAARRERVPEALDEVLRDVAADRIGRSLERGRPLLTPTIDFWNGLVDGL